MRPAFVFDPNRCTACEACRVACGIENGGGRDTGWRTVATFNPARHPALPTRHFALACNHCETAVCAAGCPAAAYERDATTGAVLLREEKCIGCRYCSWLCPYDAPKFDRSRGVMTKCSFCASRLAEGGAPACTTACPTGALTLGARDGSEPDPGPLVGEFGIGPALHVKKPRLAHSLPSGAFDDVPPQPPGPRKITPASEWALLVFTIVMPALVAWLAGGMVRPERRPSSAAFFALGAVAVALSTIHLGKPLRAWRAVLNARRSWLSREILFAMLFLALGAAPLLAVPALAAGLALAFCIDAVYRAIPLTAPRRVHSADAIPTVALLFGIVAGVPAVTIAAAAAKAILYGWRWTRGAPGVPLPASIARLLLLTTACTPALPWPIASGIALAGELIDRVAFYGGIEPTTPALRMALQVRSAAGAGR